MYVITFYSFKGGVGRTMALVNVAAELVRRGRKVLAVDFDLEAPGLETYKHLQPEKPHPGLVEYVTEFRRSYQVPDLGDYIYETKPIGEKGGKLWVMPAGRRDLEYRKALSNLDWKKLYNDQDGFLLFEDTKKGWEEEYHPDYVLIDSRTGDTDVKGICTRQLPDAVVLMFTPNEQNLVGLENVCRDIRREETEGLKKKIRLHFVAANVPDLDDENRVLRRQMRAFKERLEFQTLSGVIRRYEDLSLLDQSIAVLHHRRSRLARSFRRLLEKLIKDNPADRDGALLLLKELAQAYLPSVATDVSSEVGRRLGDRPFTEISRRREEKQRDQDRLNEIAANHLDDIEILKKIAECHVLKEDLASAIRFLVRVFQLQKDDADAADTLFKCASCQIELGDLESAEKNLMACLERPLRDAQPCLQRLSAIAPARLIEVADLFDEGALEACVNPFKIAKYLCDTEQGIPRAVSLARKLCSETLTDDWDQFEDVNILLRTRCWAEIIQLHEAGMLEDNGPETLIYVALAYWGKIGQMPEPLCLQALESWDSNYLRIWGKRSIAWVFNGLTVPVVDRRGSPEHFLALDGKALLLWRVGRVAEALECLDKTEQNTCANMGKPTMVFRECFSWWRLLSVSSEQYLDDCQKWRRLFHGESLRPEFLGPPST